MERLHCFFLFGWIKLRFGVGSSGGSRQNLDRVLIQKSLVKNEIFVRFRSNLDILMGFQKPFDPVWIRHWVVILGF